MCLCFKPPTCTEPSSLFLHLFGADSPILFAIAHSEGVPPCPAAAPIFSSQGFPSLSDLAEVVGVGGGPCHCSIVRTLCPDLVSTWSWHLCPVFALNNDQCPRILQTKSLSSLRPPLWLHVQDPSRKCSLSSRCHSHHIKPARDCRYPLCPSTLHERRCPWRICHLSVSFWTHASRLIFGDVFLRLGNNVCHG